jgi:hypothetical protein
LWFAGLCSHSRCSSSTSTPTAGAIYVFRHSNPTLVTIAVTVETALRRADLPRLSRAGPLARLIARQAETFARRENYEARYGRTCGAVPDDTINFQHDALACAIALGWKDGVEISEVPLASNIEAGWLRQRVDCAGWKMGLGWYRGRDSNPHALAGMAF